MSKYKVEIACDLSEPALVPATFDLIRLYARAYGLPDIGHIYIGLQVEFEGNSTERKVNELATRLDQLWIGGLRQLEPEAQEVG